MTTIYKFKSFYTEEGIGAAPSSAPVATVIDTDADSKLATEQATTSLANLIGYYEYEYSGADNLDLVCLFHTSDTGTDQQDLVSYVVEKVYQADAKLDVIDGIVDAILVDTGTDIPASITTVQADLDNPSQYKADVSALALEATLTAMKGAGWTTETLVSIKAVIDDILTDTGTTLDTKLNTIDGIVDDILVDTGTTLPAVLDAIKGAGWTDEDLVAIKEAVDSVKTWTAANISSSVTSGKITQIRGDTWDFEIPDLTLDSNLIQFAIKETKLDADAQALLLIDTATGLLYVNGAAASDATKASLSYVGTTLTVKVDASITAQLPTAGNYHYGIQSVTAAGVVSESYGGTFIITADTVRATA